MRRAVRYAQVVLAVCVTGIVSVVVGAILGVQGSSPAAAPAPAPVVLEETPDALPKRAPVTPRKPATVTKVVLGPGDTLSALAERHGTTVKKLQRLNGLGTSTLINAGDTLRIRPAQSTATDPEIVARSHPPVRSEPDQPSTSGKRRLPETSGRAAKAVAYARAQLGKPYIWGGTGPHGFDCSGLVMRAWKNAGVDLPRTTWQQIRSGEATTRARLVAGDLVLGYGGGHVQLYIGNGKVIHAPRSYSTVTIAPLPPPSQVVAYRHITA